jgi:hypothetical protein
MTSLMEKFDFDALRKMPPDRRVKALKELQEKLSEFIRQRSQEIADSQREIKDAQDFLAEAEEELSVLEEMQSRAPGLKQVKVEELFERGEKKEARAERSIPEHGRELESIAEEAPRQAPPAEDQRAYVNFLSRQPLSNIYERINQIRDDIRHTGTVSLYQQEKLGQFREALHEKEEAIRAGEYAAGKKTEAMLTAAEKAVMYVTGEHRDKQFYRTHH